MTLYTSTKQKDQLTQIVLIVEIVELNSTLKLIPTDTRQTVPIVLVAHVHVRALDDEMSNQEVIIGKF